jgi:amphi-Trp domain-containing protein
MKEKEVEKVVHTKYFVSVLRRMADALEKGESFRIQIQNRRVVVPPDAELEVEHEVEGEQQELSLELHWKSETPSAQ